MLPRQQPPLEPEDRVPGVVLQPAARAAFRRGIEWMLAAVRPTLGPVSGLVAAQGAFRARAPELLDDAGTIARRLVEMPDRDADPGAMYLRSLLWGMQERCGDGTATAAVLFGSVYGGAVRYVAAGGDATRLRCHLARGLSIVLDALAAQSRPLEGETRLAQVAASICHDPDLAGVLGEMLDIVGPYGQVEIREGRGRELQREYVEGAYWEGGVLATELLPAPAGRAFLADPAVLLADCDASDPADVAAALDAALRGGHRSLLIVARSLSPAATALLMAPQNRARIDVLVARMPTIAGVEQPALVQDLALLTGATPLLRDAGMSLAEVRPDQLGRARHAWVDRERMGIVGGQGAARRLREHVAALRRGCVEASDPAARSALRLRLGKLSNGSAILWIGGHSPTAIAVRRENAERTCRALAAGMLEGSVPGGGAAWLACRPRLRAALDGASDADERAAYRILLAALAEPVRTIATNAGHEPGRALACLAEAGPGCVFDVSTGRVADAWTAGIIDLASVAREGLRLAVEGACLALTVDAIVHRRRPPASLAPG